MVPTPTIEPIAHLAPGDPLILTNIRMVDNLIGWAIGGPTAQSHHTLRTLDGGRSWLDVTPPEQGRNTERHEAFFLDGNRAWVLYFRFATETKDPAAATVWRTEDGGQSWTGSPSPSTFGAYHEPFTMSFADDQNGWLVAGGIAAGGMRLSMYQTKDGGANWETRPEGEDLCGDTTEMAFADALWGWWTGLCGGRGPVSETRDGGNSWRFFEVPVPPGEPEDMYAYCDAMNPRFFSASSGLFRLTCRHEEGPREYLYRTDDGGQSWQFHPLPGGEIQFVTPEVGFSLGSRIYKTTDGGQTWQLTKTVSWQGQFSFVDERQGWAVARAEDGHVALVRTTDSGRAWEELEPQVVE